MPVPFPQAAFVYRATGVCRRYSSHADSIDHFPVSDLVRAIAIATDALVLVMTWIKTYSIYKAAKRAKFETGLSSLVIRDGSTYFG